MLRSLDCVPAGILVYSETKGVIAVNRIFGEIVGRSAVQIEGLRIEELTHPEDLVANGWLLENSIRTHQSFTINKRYLRPDGEVVWAEDRYEILPSMEQNPIVVLICRRLDALPLAEQVGALRDCDYADFVEDMCLQLSAMAERSGHRMCADVLRLAAKVAAED